MEHCLFALVAQFFSDMMADKNLVIVEVSNNRPKSYRTIHVEGARLSWASFISLGVAVMLLHNIFGPGFRGMAEPGAGVGMYRTPPLWGIKDTAPYLHDGRAETLESAIELHKGEAQGVRDAYTVLSPEDQQALVLFLRDL